VSVSRVFQVLALVFFILAALLMGGVITASGLNWLIPAGLASWVLAEIVALCF
jgi:hypothetical protein